MGAYRKIPVDLLEEGWLFSVGNAARTLFLAALRHAGREPRRAWDCGAWVALQPGEWLMSMHELAQFTGVDRKTLHRGLDEIGPEGTGFLRWKRASEHQNARWIFSVCDPASFIGVVGEKFPDGMGKNHRPLPPTPVNGMGKIPGPIRARDKQSQSQSQSLVTPYPLMALPSNGVSGSTPHNERNENDAYQRQMEDRIYGKKDRTK